jgi:quercetin dioxygenase-like cupin family protein
MQLIEFFDLNDTEGWEPVTFNAPNQNELWAGGGLLADAPVDVAKTLNGTRQHSLRVDSDFVMAGARWKPDFTTPWFSSNLRQLFVIIGGELTIESETSDKKTIALGEFVIIPADEKVRITTGSEGVVYVETWPVWVQQYTTWHPGDGWV